MDEHIKGVKSAGLQNMITEQPTSIVVSGVDKDSEKCSVIPSVPGVLEDGAVIQYDAPRIPGSSVPALCGMQTLDQHNLGVLPWSSQLVKVPKGKEHEIKWPEGTTFIQCKRAKTGHLMLPIGRSGQAKRRRQPSEDRRLAFLASERVLGISASPDAPIYLPHAVGAYRPC